MLQIWILPEKASLEPGYEEKYFSVADKTDQFRLLGSRDGRNGSVTIHQDMDLYASLLSAGTELTHTFGANRKGWLQVVSGDVLVNDQRLSTGDGAALQDLTTLHVKASNDAEVLLFDMG